MSDFSLPRKEKWFREIGRYDNIEIEDTDEDTIYCRVTDDETVLVGEVMGREHAWVRVEDNKYKSACRGMRIPSTMLPAGECRHALIERVPCNHCQSAL